VALSSKQDRPATRAVGLGGLFFRSTATPSSVADFLRLLAPEAIDQPLIRLGGSGDGGYLVPDDLDGIEYAISPGVSTVATFDEDLAARGIDVVMLDASVKKPPIHNPHFTFLPMWLDSYDSDTTMTLQTLADRFPDDADLLLEMDIEGAEWRVIHSMSRALQERFRIMVIELHPMEDVGSKARLADFEAGIRKLLQTHRVVHIHQNNASQLFNLGGHKIASAIEITLHRRDRSAPRPEEPVPLPHPLDRPNLSWLPDYRVPDVWKRA